MIVWVEKRLVIAIHDRGVAEHGGSAGIRDKTMLESALARPQQLYAYGDPPPDMADLAAALAFGLARNHPFVDGNKRTAAVACETFIELNDGRLNAEDSELFQVYVALARGELTQEEFAAWLRDRIQITPRNEVQESRARYQVSARKKRKRAAGR
jgi:death-on-curing protein